MHDGVIRDIAQQRLRQERRADFEMQKLMEAEYKKDQDVRDGTSG
jgi:protein PET117